MEKANDSFSSPVYSGKLIEEYLESGAYRHLKELKCEKEAIQKNIQDHLMNHESKRHEIGNHLVAKFFTRKVYQYDYVGLNEYLYDRGLLQKLTKLSSNQLKEHQNLLDLFEPYQLKPEFYIKPSLNKAGKEMVKVELPDYSELCLERAAKKKRDNMNSLRAAILVYNNLKSQIATCEQLQSEKKVKHQYGSLSYIQKPFIYDVKQITDHQAIQGLIEFGKPNMDQLDFYMVRGFISKSEVESFRILTNLKLEFAIFDIDEEAVMLSSLSQKAMSENFVV